MAEIDEKILKKKNEILRLVKDNKNCDTQGDEIVKLREDRYNLILEDVNKAGFLQKIEDLKSFLSKQSAEVQEYDDSLVRRLIDTITVYDDNLKVKFKSGIEVEVRD